MTETAQLDAYGVLTEPATLTIQRLLPGPVERIWAYLTDSKLRSQWLAAGEMTMTVGAPFEWVWRNDELTDPPGQRPAGFGADHRMQSQITALEPPHKLAITWGETGGVSFELKPVGARVLLTVIHHRVLNHATRLNVSAGWHSHLDLLVARANDAVPAPFWDSFTRLKADYACRMPE